jgi:hypothetical protein
MAFRTGVFRVSGVVAATVRGPDATATAPPLSRRLGFHVVAELNGDAFRGNEVNGRAFMTAGRIRRGE